MSRSFVSSDRQKDRQATSPTTFKQHTFIKIHHRGITSEKRLEAKCANLTAPNCSYFAIVMMCSGFFFMLAVWDNYQSIFFFITVIESYGKTILSV